MVAWMYGVSSAPARKFDLSIPASCSLRGAFKCPPVLVSAETRGDKKVEAASRRQANVGIVGEDGGVNPPLRPAGQDAAMKS